MRAGEHSRGHGSEERVRRRPGLGRHPMGGGDVSFDMELRRLHITLDDLPGSQFPHPATGRPLRTYDSAECPGRHLNFFQFECCVRAHVPRVDAESSCPERQDHRRGGPRHRRESAEGLARPGPGRGQRPGLFRVARRVVLDLQRAKGRGPCGRGRRGPRRAGRGAGSGSRRPCGGSRRPGGLRGVPPTPAKPGRGDGLGRIARSAANAPVTRLKEKPMAGTRDAMECLDLGASRAWHGEASRCGIGARSPSWLGHGCFGPGRRGG